MRTHAAAFLVLIFTWSTIAQESKPADPVRTTIERAIDWIERQAIPVKDSPDAVMFRDSAEAAGPAAAEVYGGTAGVLIFLENAAAALDNERARKLANATMKGLMVTRGKDEKGATWAKSDGGPGPSSLYVGDAGIGAAFLVRARLRKDAAARAVATTVAEGILARGTREEDKLSWPNGETDIIFGAAGTALFLLDMWKETQDKRFLEAAVAAGHWLVSQAVVGAGGPESRERRLLWRSRIAGNRHLPNFSHGTAGIAYALARIGSATGDKICAEGARDGAAWLLDHAIKDDLGVRWAASEGGTKCLGGWCHGPPGTARLFLVLHGQTGEQRYLDAAVASARWLMNYGGYAGKKGEPPRGLPPSLCCGVAGVLDFFCDLYRATGKEEYAAFAARAGDYLIQGSETDGAGVKWVNGASSHENKATEHGIDLMLGASGEAMALLRLATLRQNPDPVQHLPDRAVSAR